MQWKDYDRWIKKDMNFSGWTEQHAWYLDENNRWQRAGYYDKNRVWEGSGGVGEINCVSGHCVLTFGGAWGVASGSRLPVDIWWTPADSITPSAFKQMNLASAKAAIAKPPSHKAKAWGRKFAWVGRLASDGYEHAFLNGKDLGIVLLRQGGRMEVVQPAKEGRLWNLYELRDNGSLSFKGSYGSVDGAPPPPNANRPAKDALREGETRDGGKYIVRGGRWVANPNYVSSAAAAVPSAPPEYVYPAVPPEYTVPAYPPGYSVYPPGYSVYPPSGVATWPAYPMPPAPYTPPPAYTVTAQPMPYYPPAPVPVTYEPMPYMPPVVFAQQPTPDATTAAYYGAAYGAQAAIEQAIAQDEAQAQQDAMLAQLYGGGGFGDFGGSAGGMLEPSAGAYGAYGALYGL